MPRYVVFVKIEQHGVETIDFGFATAVAGIFSAQVSVVPIEREQHAQRPDWIDEQTYRHEIEVESHENLTERVDKVVEQYRQQTQAQFYARVSQERQTRSSGFVTARCATCDEPILHLPFFGWAHVGGEPTGERAHEGKPRDDDAAATVAAA